MPLSLHDHLRRRLPAAYRQLSRAFAGVADADAAAGARGDWQQYRFGVGLDGSIRGIILHVAAWKRAAAEGLESGSFPPVEEALPEALNWEELLGALGREQARLEATLEKLAPEDLEREVVWEGQPMTTAEVFTHLLEHDQYHAGQINLLRQQRGDVFPEGR